MFVYRKKRAAQARRTAGVASQCSKPDSLRGLLGKLIRKQQPLLSLPSADLIYFTGFL